MPDQRFREIQLTGKQLVFLFMASVVVAVSIFLLGVSVGRGVRGTTQVAAEPAADQPGPAVPAVMPPETKPTPADLSYHAKLQGQTPASQASTGAPAPAPAEAARFAAPPPAAADQGRTASASPPTPAPVPTRASTPPATKPAQPAAGGFFVQTDAFGTRANADKRVAELKGKGHAAFVVTPGPPFRVRIGPFAAQAEADRVAAQLRAEGLKPSVTP
jgi:cell division septation protein DedD